MAKVGESISLTTTEYYVVFQTTGENKVFAGPYSRAGDARRKMKEYEKRIINPVGKFAVAQVQSYTAKVVEFDEEK